MNQANVHLGPKIRLAFLWAGTLGLALLAGCGGGPGIPDADNGAERYWIVGSIAERLEEGEVVLSRGNGVVGGTEEIARAELRGGAFEIEGELDFGGVVFLGVTDAEGNAKGSARFILEPGEIRIEDAGRVAGLVAHGGPYNQKIIASWRDSAPYQEALAAYSDVMARRQGVEEGDEGFEELRDETWERYNALQTIRSDALRALAQSEEVEPLTSLYAVQMGGIGGEPALKRLDALEAVLGAHLAITNTRSRIRHSDKLMAAAGAMKKGVTVKDFSSTGLDGQEYFLQDARSSNDYTLIEFWASWCGPCRAEYPNLIANYEQYKPQGFEIFAYSLDDDRDDWAEASEEDGIPWINTSDLLAYASPIPEQFGVTAIPMNYLLDAEGVVVAINLRADKLGEKLAEFFDPVPQGASEESPL